MAQFPERLIVLEELTNGIMARLHNVKCKLADEKGRPVSSDPQLGKLTSAVLKSFPEPPGNLEKLSGYDYLQAHARDIHEELQEVYLTFLDVLNYKETVHEVLIDMATNLSSFRYDENPDLMRWFMKLVIGYMKVQLYIARVPDKKLVMGLYGRAYASLSGSSESNFARLATMMGEIDNPIPRIQRDLLPMASRIGDTINSLKLTYMYSLNVNYLRKQHIFNPVPNVEKGFISDPVTDQTLYEMARMDEMTEWILYGFLACPDALLGGHDLWKEAIESNFVVPLYGEDVVYIHEEYETHVVGNKKSKYNKLQPVVQQAAVTAIGGAGIKHKDLRRLLMVELKHLTDIFSDSPGLLGPRFQQVLTAISMARHELQWYFLHRRAPPKVKGSKYREETYVDTMISTLIYAIDNLTDLVRRHSIIIQRYFVEFLAKPDTDALKRLLGEFDTSSWEPGVNTILQTTVKDLASMHPKQVDENKVYKFDALRLQWYKVIAWLTSASSKNAKNTENLSRLVNMLIYHTRNVDHIEEQLREFGSLKQLYFHQDRLFSIFEASVSGTEDQPLHCMAFVRMLNHFHENGHGFLPERRVEIGHESVQLAIKYLRVIMTRLENLLGAINGVHGFEKLRRQVAPVRAINLVTQAETYREPGYESYPEEAHKLAEFWKYQNNIAQLCAAMHTVDTIMVYDHEFVPREWIFTLLALSMRSFLGTGIDNLGNILRPSTVERATVDYVTALKLIENHVNVDVGNIVCQALLEQFCDVTLTGVVCNELETGQKRSREKEVQAKAADGEKKKPQYIRRMSEWFIKFITQTVPSDGILLSNNRMAFISPPSLAQQFRAEDYVDHLELRSLCALVGPYGVRAIDYDLLHALANFTGGIKEYINQNKGKLVMLRDNFHVESTCAQAIRDLKGLDDVIAKAVSVGLCLRLRGMLRESLAVVVRERIPYVYQAVDVAQDQYDHPPVLSGVPAVTVDQYNAVDQAALDAGILDDNVDANLRSIFKSLNATKEDHETWTLAPYLFAVLFTTRTWKDAEYRVDLEAHTGNLHTMVDSFYTIMVMMESISVADQKEPPAHLRVGLGQFVKTASSILLRMRPQQMTSMLVFMDKFIQRSPELPRSLIDNCLPYALIRMAYMVLYESAHQDAEVIAGPPGSEFQTAAK